MIKLDLYMCQNKGCEEECSHEEVNLYKGINGEPVCEECFGEKSNELWERRESWESPKTLEIDKLRAENDFLCDENNTLREWYENKYNCACGFVNVTDKCNLHSPHIHKLEKELSELKQANEWQPIDSAPKDGTEILVLHDFGKIEVLFWDDHLQWSDGNYRDKVEKLTDWKPLPSAPK